MDKESTGGAISFEMLVETGQLDRASDESIKRIKGISRESVAAGKAVDDFFGATTDNIKIQKDVIGSLEKKYSDLQKEIDKLAPGKAQAQLRKEAAGIKAELEAEKSTLTQLEGAVKQNEKAHESFRTQLRRVREELIAMEMAGKRGTAEYKVLQDEAGRLTDAMSDAQAQASVLAHDQRGLQGVIAAVSGIAGGFSAAQGAIGLFVGENENLQKIMLKVQSLMAITIGLQQIQQTLDKDSAFMLVTVAKAKELYASATNRLTVALGLSNVAAKALMATLTLGLSAAIGAAIYFIDRYISKQKEAAKKQEEFSKAISEEAYKAVSSIETLSAKYKSLGDNLKAKEKFIKDNANAFDDLGVSVRNVEEAENILIKNKESFIRAQIEKAKSIAATQIAAEKWKEWLTNEEKLSKTQKYVTKNTTTYTGPGQSAVETSKTTVSDEYYDLSSKQIKIRAEINKLMELSVEADSAAGKIISGLGVNSEKALEGSIIAIENALSELNQKYKEAISDPERKALAEQIKTQEAKLQSLQPEKKTDSKDPFSEQLEKRKKLYQDYFNWINSNRPDLAESAKKEFENLLKGGNSFIESLEKQAKELEGKKGITDEQKKQLKTIRDYIATEVKTTALDTFEKELTAKLEAAKTTLQKISILDASKPAGGSDLDKAKQDIIDSEKEKTLKQERDLTNELLSHYAGYLQEKIQFNESYAEKKRLLNLGYEKAEGEDAKKIAKEALAELDRQKEQYSKKSGNKEYDELVNRYKNFKQQLDGLIADFDKEIKTALDNGNKELSETILKAKNEEVKKIVKGFSKDEVSQYLESLKKSLAVQIGISLATGKQTEELARVNALIELINKGLKAGGNEDIVKGLDVAIGSLQQITGIVDDKSRRMLENLGGALSGVAMVYSGDVFNGVKQLVFSVSDGLDKQFGMQKRIADIEKERAEYNRRISVALDDINYDLEKQLKLLNDLSINEAYNPTIEALKASISAASNELENLRLDFAKSPPNIKITFDIDDLKKIAQTDDATKALNDAFSKGIITQEQYNLAVEYLNTIESAEDRLKQLHDEYKNAILGTTSESLADSIMEGLLAGKRGIEDFADTFEEMMKKALINSMMMKSIQPQIDDFMNVFYNASNDENGLTPSDVENLKLYFGVISSRASKSVEDMEALFPDLFSTADKVNSLSGSIKGVTEETAGLIAGQMNAIRINQAHALALMDEQLANLSEIASNTRYNRLLVDIKNLLQSSKSNSVNENRANGGL